VNRTGRCEKRERRRDDFRTRPGVDGPERQQQCVRSIRATIAYFVCESSATSLSNCSTGAPRMNSCESTSASSAGKISSRIVACCARRSKRGTGMVTEKKEPRPKIDAAKNGELSL